MPCRCRLATRRFVRSHSSEAHGPAPRRRSWVVLLKRARPNSNVEIVDVRSGRPRLHKRSNRLEGGGRVVALQRLGWVDPDATQASDGSGIDDRPGGIRRAIISVRSKTCNCPSSITSRKLDGRRQRELGVSPSSAAASNGDGRLSPAEQNISLRSDLVTDVYPFPRQLPCFTLFGVPDDA